MTTTEDQLLAAAARELAVEDWERLAVWINKNRPVWVNLTYNPRAQLVIDGVLEPNHNIHVVLNGDDGKVMRVPEDVLKKAADYLRETDA